MPGTQKIKLHNVLTRRKEMFRPIRKKWVGLYTCGPTVYNFAHVGNLRTYIFEDVLRRTLDYAGYKVRHVMNITDVDDKIIRDSRAAGKKINAFVQPYETAFFDDLKKLYIQSAWKYPKATGHIREMVHLISVLLKKRLAYKMGGSIYFDISKFKKYGRLGRINKVELKSGARVDADEYTKKDIQDFVLWKTKKPGEPSWPAPFGKGRPGWHIECSAMSMKYLGSTFDIHAGGVDLIFPHHENEIAQSEGATGKPFVRFFVEGEHLLVNGEKMSKSLGNILTLREIETRGFNPLVLRYLVLTSHYRSKLNLTWNSLEAAENSLERLYDFIRNLKGSFSTNSKNKNVTVRAQSRTYLNIYRNKFEQSTSNDLDTPRALAVVWGIMHAYNKSPAKFNSKDVLELLINFDKILGLRLKEIKPKAIPESIQALIAKREEYRKRKEWAKADLIRKELNSRGYILEDRPEGPRIKV